MWKNIHIKISSSVWDTTTKGSEIKDQEHEIECLSNYRPNWGKKGENQASQDSYVGGF